jgi:hypothetical protein
MLPVYVGPLELGRAVPDAIAASGEAGILTVQAEGAQIYECKADSGGKLVWQFREPIAALPRSFWSTCHRTRGDVETC